MSLTTQQVAALREIAERAGKRVYISRTQVGIGETGVLAFNVVYTHGANRPWQLRSESDRPLKEAMKAVVG